MLYTCNKLFKYKHMNNVNWAYKSSKVHFINLNLNISTI